MMTHAGKAIEGVVDPLHGDEERRSFSYCTKVAKKKETPSITSSLLPGTFFSS